MTKKIKVKFIKEPEDIFEVADEQLVSLRVSRDFTIEVKESGEQMTINKWVSEGEHEDTESDWEFVDKKDKELHDKMSEEDQDQFYDFVQGLQVIK